MPNGIGEFSNKSLIDHVYIHQIIEITWKEERKIHPIKLVVREREIKREQEKERERKILLTVSFSECIKYIDIRNNTPEYKKERPNSDHYNAIFSSTFIIIFYNKQPLIKYNYLRISNRL